MGNNGVLDARERSAMLRRLATARALEQLRERDRRDRTRAESPLAPAPDAVIIDSTDLSLEQVVARVEAIVRERLAQGD